MAASAKNNKTIARQAFTLVEILAVMGIISLLLAVATVSLANLGGGASVRELQSVSASFKHAVSAARNIAVGSRRDMAICFSLAGGTLFLEHQVRVHSYFLAFRDRNQTSVPSTCEGNEFLDAPDGVWKRMTGDLGDPTMIPRNIEMWLNGIDTFGRVFEILDNPTKIGAFSVIPVVNRSAPQLEEAFDPCELPVGQQLTGERIIAVRFTPRGVKSKIFPAVVTITNGKLVPSPDRNQDCELVGPDEPRVFSVVVLSTTAQAKIYPCDRRNETCCFEQM